MAHGGISGACDELTIFHDKTAILKDQCWRHESTDLFTPETLKVDNLVTYLKSLNHGFEKSWWDVLEQTVGVTDDTPDGADQIQYVLEFEGKSLDYKKLSSEEQQKISELISPIFEKGYTLYKPYEMDTEVDPYVPPIQKEEVLPVPLGMEGYQPPSKN